MTHCTRMSQAHSTAIDDFENMGLMVGALGLDILIIEKEEHAIADEIIDGLTYELPACELSQLPCFARHKKVFDIQLTKSKPWVEFNLANLIHKVGAIPQNMCLRIEPLLQDVR